MIEDPPLATEADWESLSGQSATPATAYQLEVASARIRDHCGWQISQRLDDEVTARRVGHHLLILPTLFLTEVHRVTHNGDLVDRSLYDWNETGVIHLHRLSFVGKWQAVINHGYRPVPLTVVSECVSRAGLLAANPAGAVSVRVGNVSTTYAYATSGPSSDFGPNLERYRLPPRA